MPERNTRHEVRSIWTALLLATVTVGVCVTASFGQTVVRVGAFPNIITRKPWWVKTKAGSEKALGSGIKIDWKSFNAGPSAIEALFAGALDITYMARICDHGLTFVLTARRFE